ncbi:bacteriocin transport accessory protein, putative [Clostridium sp. DSM 8431]|uniref:thioredoxin domain-containing protein n=1 Tax=Clostridium sp. DSM 8431 TaxID=1761781 RepID=UPI0008F36F50|nr:thioredoxin domain-containing protein [Clostridium sp. DSM 8431]SFU72056.1 bacteriocin transport accessory protein, putative [Clostridium sp. DSM 8431]
MNMEDLFYEHVSIFKKIESDKADKLLNSEDKVFVFIGRSTCPYCRKFAVKLSSAASKTNAQVYYVDSENFDDINIQAFRDKFNIRTVPGFLIRKNGEVDVRCDSSIPEEELIDILES